MCTRGQDIRLCLSAQEVKKKVHPSGMKGLAYVRALSCADRAFQLQNNGLVLRRESFVKSLTQSKE